MNAIPWYFQDLEEFTPLRTRFQAQLGIKLTQKNKNKVAEFMKEFGISGSPRVSFGFLIVGDGTTARPIQIGSIIILGIKDGSLDYIIYNSNNNEDSIGVKIDN